MKKYNRPFAEVIEIETADVIATSGGQNPDPVGTFVSSVFETGVTLDNINEIFGNIW